MRKQELIDLFNLEQRINIEYPGSLREADGPVVRQVARGGEESYISYSSLMNDNADEMIQRELAYFKRLGQSFEWKLYDFDEPADLKERLQAHGFQIGEAEALMLMELIPGHQLLTASIPESVRQITNESGIDELVALEERIWDEPFHELGERLKHDLSHTPDELLIYGAYDDHGNAVSAAWMYMHQGTSFCSLWGGSTLPEHRGKGLYTSLLAARAQEALKRGYPLMTVDASPMSRPILERKGFQCLGYTYPCMSPSH